MFTILCRRCASGKHMHAHPPTRNPQPSSTTTDQTTHLSTPPVPTPEDAAGGTGQVGGGQPPQEGAGKTYKIKYEVN